MRRIQTEVLVVGGGATGLGVLRDLAMRGFEAVLVEQRDLTHGTTGRYHGLLHSGGRYVVKDPQAATECIEENRVLRRIMPHSIEDTGGFFVVTPWDDLDYVPRFVVGCEEAGIPVTEVPIGEALKREPHLNPSISHCFEVPDAAADSFLAAEATAASAREHGATVLTYHQVESLMRIDDRVAGATCRDLVTGEKVAIAADLVVNASGAWAGRIAHTAGVDFEVQAGKGTMLALNHRVVNTVLNRCKMPDDGDIIVPIRTVAVIGTTDEGVPDPERFSVEPWEVKLMLEEGDKLVPGVSGMRVLRAWAGVRPLYQEDTNGETRDVTRAYALLDHHTRDGVDGFLTITGGKWTTFRQMAEVTVDAVCAKLDVERECRTHSEEMPDPTGRPGSYQTLGSRLARVEQDESFGDLVCECELVTRSDVVKAVMEGDARTIDDIRREVRLGMGPCQGGWCLPRVAGILHETRRPPVVETNVALRDFLHERWKGMAPVLWGDQLRQARLDDLVFTRLLAVPSLAGPMESPLAPVMYEPAEDRTPVPAAPPPDETPATTVRSPRVDVLVVGGGLSGLTAAWRAATSGATTTLLTKGWGSLIWDAGTIGVLDGPSPGEAVEDLISENPSHPYAIAGMGALREALEALKRLCAGAGYPLTGSLDHNFAIPTGIGGARSSCLVPETMAAGNLSETGPMLVVGLAGFGDFSPDLVADNIATGGIETAAMSVDLPSVRRRRFVNGSVLAAMFENEAFRAVVAASVRPHLDGATRVGFPAVLGMEHASTVVNDLSGQLGVPVFEIPTLPPSMPGLRLQRILRRAIVEAGGRVVDNSEAVAIAADGSLAVTTRAAGARHQVHPASRVVLATGGILGGGITGHADGTLRENVAGLNVTGVLGREEWFAGDASPVYRSGVMVDTDLRPIDGPDGLVAAGQILAGGDGVIEGSLEGVSLVTGWRAGEG